MKNIIIVSAITLALVTCQVHPMVVSSDRVVVQGQETKADVSTLSRAVAKPAQAAEISFEIDLNEKQRDPKWLKINWCSSENRIVLPYGVNWQVRRAAPTLHVFARQESGYDADRDGETWDLEYAVEESALRLRSRAVVRFGLSSTLDLVKNYKKQATLQHENKQYFAQLAERLVFEQTVRVSIKALADKSDKKSHHDAIV